MGNGFIWIGIFCVVGLYLMLRRGGLSDLDCEKGYEIYKSLEERSRYKR